ncbi:MAG: hemin receptor [Chitinophagaceae bacterium]|nr:hemin receptor [Rubrivivax sp.]
MTPRDIELVQSSFSKVAPSADSVAAIFYGRLFEMDPALKPLFKSDLAAQGGKLMTMLATVVNGLPTLDRLVPAAESLGKRHVPYGVKPEHYATVGGALLATLEAGLGEGFTPEVRSAWTKTYGVVSSVMIEAAYVKGSES